MNKKTDSIRPHSVGWTEYYRGYLAKDRENSFELDQMASGILSQAEDGKVFLAQRRNGFCDFSYLMRSAR